MSPQRWWRWGTEASRRAYLRIRRFVGSLGMGHDWLYIFDYLWLLGGISVPLIITSSTASDRRGRFHQEGTTWPFRSVNGLPIAYSQKLGGEISHSTRTVTTYRFTCTCGKDCQMSLDLTPIMPFTKMFAKILTGITVSRRHIQHSLVLLSPKSRWLTTETIGYCPLTPHHWHYFGMSSKLRHRIETEIRQTSATNLNALFYLREIMDSVARVQDIWILSWRAWYGKPLGWISVSSFMLISLLITWDENQTERNNIPFA
jgi:hypothetical protein